MISGAKINYFTYISFIIIEVKFANEKLKVIFKHAIILLSMLINQPSNW